MTVFWKTDLMVTNNEIQFLPVDESHTYVLSRDTMHFRLDGQVCFYRWHCKTTRCISWPVWPLRGINKTTWGTKLILTADPTYPVSCASLGHLLMAQHCHLCSNVCLSPLTAQPPILNPRYYSHQKSYLKNQGHSNSL